LRTTGPGNPPCLSQCLRRVRFRSWCETLLDPEGNHPDPLGRIAEHANDILPGPLGIGQDESCSSHSTAHQRRVEAHGQRGTIFRQNEWDDVVDGDDEGSRQAKRCREVGDVHESRLDCASEFRDAALLPPELAHLTRPTSGWDKDQRPCRVSEVHGWLRWEREGHDRIIVSSQFAPERERVLAAPGPWLGDEGTVE
jgi:hypothetical protein